MCVQGRGVGVIPLLIIALGHHILDLDSAHCAHFVSIEDLIWLSFTSCLCQTNTQDSCLSGSYQFGFGYFVC